MADISKIKLNNVDYNIKDNTARTMATESVHNARLLDIERNFIFLGDSYGMRNTSKPTWTEILVKKYTGRARQTSMSGYGFLSGDGTNFLTLIQNYNNTLTTDEKEAITDIVVCGGWNDARALKNGRTPSELVNAITVFTNFCNTNFINAKVWIGFIGWQTAECVQPETNLDMLYVAQSIYNEVALSNLYHLDGVSDIMKNSFYFDETYFHPNPLGSSILAEGINNAFSGGFSYKYNKTLSSSDFTIPSGASCTFGGGKISVSGGIAKISMVLLNVTPTNTGEIITFNQGVLPYGYNVDTKVNSFIFPNGKNLYGIIGTNRTFKVYDEGVSNNAIIFNATIDITSEN